MTSSKQRYKQYREQRGFLGQKQQQHDKQPGGQANLPGKPPHPGPQGPPCSPDGALDKKKKLTYYLKRYFTSIKRYKKHIILLIVLSFASLVLNAVNPWISKFMLDYIFAATPKVPDLGSFLNQYVQDMQPKQLLVTVCAALAIVAILEIVMRATSEYIGRLLGAKMEVDVRRQLIKHLQVMALSKIERLKTGGIISRVEGDVSNFSSLLHQGLLAPLHGLTMFAIGLGSLVFISPTITLVCLVFIILLACAAYFMFNVMRPLFRDLHEDRSRISGKLAETFSGIRVVRVFGREAAETSDFIGSHNLLIRKMLHTEKINIGTRRIMDTISWGMDISIWLIGGIATLNGKITIGDLIVFTRFTKWFFHPVFMIMHNLSQVQNSVACTERIFDMLDEPADILDKPDAISVSTIAKEIRFDHVDFAYEPDKPVLKDLSLTIPAGKTLALVGPSGAGKTTITNLLVRFYDPNKGTINLDNTDIANLKLRDYRDMFSLVLQDIFLFDGTIEQNIAYSKPEATPEEIRQAAIIAAADEFICEFPDKYKTVIGERGVKLSGGQKQRISLARAVLKNPKILILDEATSSLDTHSEQLIQNAMKQILKNRTTIVIAHRLSTIIEADQIAVVQDGKICELGTHQELLALNGFYAEMFNKQNKSEPNGVFNWGDENNQVDENDRHGQASRYHHQGHGPRMGIFR